ncbi:MAG: AAC(3) family N-acetyltransferase [Crocinitomicaceae bacterium]|nr:AAC(3) family N-acetyltransferase [Crocinitomicaceae bacterium]
MRDFLRSITPAFLLEWNRNRKKNNRREALEKQKTSGKALSIQDLINDFKSLGIRSGDVILVHSSLSKIGYIENGPKTLIRALQNLVGDEGTILMPTSPNAEYQYDFIKKNPVFDVINTPSKTGKITEVFRTSENVVRSVHPTEPVAAWGKNAQWFVEGHFGELTPYTEKSPFKRVSDKNGKLVYIGVTLDNAGTNLHTLEDALDFKFPIYANEIFEVEVIDENGVKHLVKTKAHNPEFSKKRKCDQLIPLFEQVGILTRGKIGEAPTLVFEAKGFFDTMVKLYKEKGVTMYTPKGSE